MDLDDAYANAAHIPRAEDYPPRWAAQAAALRRALGSRARTDQPYGPQERERFDVFLPQTACRGTVVFVHGGYWKAFGRADWSHLAAGALGRGWAAALPSYTLCPNIRIAAITAQIAAAITRIAGQRPGPLALAGHSAGGHLVARMLCPGVLPAPVAARIQRVLPISPVADLRPLLRTSMNDVLRLDPQEARAESPVFCQTRHRAEVRVRVGAAERPVFVDQARALADAWDCPIEIVPERHHFDVIDALADPHSDTLEWLTGECQAG